MEKKLFILLTALVLLSACGSDSREEDLQLQQEAAPEDSIPTLSGDFLFLADEAVLKGDDFIYGVEIDSLALELAEKVKSLKQEDFEMVPVTVKAKILQNPGREGWDEIIEIREVLEIPAEEIDSAQIRSTQQQ